MITKLEKANKNLAKAEIDWDQAEISLAQATETRDKMLEIYYIADAERDKIIEKNEMKNERGKA